MEYIVKKTTELSKNEKLDICNLFRNVFNKEKTLEEFDRQFLNTYCGYSLHCVIIDTNKIVGINTIIPYKYYLNNEVKVFALSVDTMIQKEYRSLGSFSVISKMLYKFSKNEGISIVFGFPNDVSYKIFKKILHWKDIGKLDFYILPINIGGFVSILKPLNVLSRLLSLFMCSSLNLSLGTEKISHPVIKKINDDIFLSQRYNNTHIIQDDGSLKYVYKIDKYNQSDIIYLIDVLPLTKKNIEFSVMKLRKKYKHKIDAILYLGNLEYRPMNLFKVPVSYQPKNIYMSCLILSDDLDNRLLCSLNEWEVNLSNMDVV
jgi:hypothetical protein